MVHQKEHMDLDSALMSALYEEQINLKRICSLLEQGANPLGICKNRNGWRIRPVVEYILNQSELNDYENAPMVIQAFFEHGMVVPETQNPLDDPEKDPLFNVAEIANEAGIRMLKVFLDQGCSIQTVENTVLHIVDGLRSKAGNECLHPDNCWFEEAVYHVKMIMLIASYPQIVEGSKLLQNLIAYNDNNTSLLIQFKDWNSLAVSFDSLPNEDPDAFLEDTVIVVICSDVKDINWSMKVSWRDYPYKYSTDQDCPSALLDKLLQMPPDLKQIEIELKGRYSVEEIALAATQYIEHVTMDESDYEAERSDGFDENKRSAYLYSIIELLLDNGLDPNTVFHDRRSMMRDLCWIGNNYAGADTLALFLERGADPMLVLEREGLSLFEDISLEVSFAAIELGKRDILDAIVHTWFVLLAHQGNKECEFFRPLTVFEDESRRAEYDLEPFEISDLKHHRHFTFGLTLQEHSWTLHIIDKRSWWEVARW